MRDQGRKSLSVVWDAHTTAIWLFCSESIQSMGFDGALGFLIEKIPGIFMKMFLGEKKAKCREGTSQKT